MKEGHNDARIVPPQSAAHPGPAHTTLRSTLELSTNLREVLQYKERRKEGSSRHFQQGDLSRGLVLAL